MIGTTPKPEVHKRIPVEEVDVTKYDDLIYKIILKYARQYGPVFLEYKEDFYVAGIMGLLVAKRVYNPDRGTFVTIAYYKIATEILQMWKSMMKAESGIDRREVEDNDDGTPLDRIENYQSISVDYEGIGKLLSPEHQLLYSCLLGGENRGKTCALCGIQWNDYPGKVAELREEVLAVHQELSGN